MTPYWGTSFNSTNKQTKSRLERRLFSLYEADDASEVFTDGGSTRQRLPNGIRDYPSQYSQSKSQKNIVQNLTPFQEGAEK